MATIQKRGESYTITASCGYDIHGKQIRRHKTWVPDPGMTPRQIEKELQRQIVLFEEDCKTGICEGGVKFEAFARQWFEEYAEPGLKSRTVSRYHQLEPRAYEALGHLRMDKITTRSVQRFVQALGKEGTNKRTGQPLAPKTIKHYLSFVSGVFSYAVSQGVVKDNPCRGVRLPTAPQAERACYTLEEAQAFLSALTDEPLRWRVFYTLAIFGGFRRGELLGLEWKDIDFETGVISIRRASLYTKERGVYTDTPKTTRSQRCLKMPDSVIDLLRRYHAEQASERLHVGDQWEDYDRLFAAWNGKPLNPSVVENWLSRFFARSGLRKVNPHSFRHLNATLLIGSGADVRTVSAALGHSQPSTTLNIYAHTFAANQAKATEAIAAALDLNFEGNKQQTNNKAH